MRLISYTLLIIYVRVDLTPYYITCLSCLMLLRENCECKRELEKLNEDLLQPSGTRYDLVSLSVRCLVSLAYWERFIFGVKLSVVVPPSHRKFLSIRKLVTPLGSVPSCFCLGFWYSMYLNFS